MSSAPSLDLRQRETLRHHALALGFVRVGFTDAAPTTEDGRALARWLARGHHGEMAYMAAHGDRSDPKRVLCEARSVIVVAMPYAKPPSMEVRAFGPSPVASYAQGADYHGVLKEKLHALARRCTDVAGHDVLARPCVDTAPLLERALAARAGVGFIGKSTMCIVPGIGTYTVLGELLVDLRIPPDAPMSPRCGRCTRCLEACPTKALTEPYALDARRCVSYLTIEQRTAIEEPLRRLVGRRVFGCDACQAVCPYNASSRPRSISPELRPLSRLRAPRAADLLGLGSSAYRRFVKGTALRRVSRHRLARNAAVALGAGGCHDASEVTALVSALRAHPSPLVRQHTAWALGQTANIDVQAALRLAAADDPDASVRREAARALIQA